jgi:hypothetical protein
MMKKLFVLLVSVLVAPAVMALPQLKVESYNTQVTPVGSYGGEMAIDLYPLNSGSDFTTFCIERHETLSNGGTYYYEVSLEAKYNNTGITPDPISKATAWLFRRFALGILADYDGSQQHQVDLQMALWWLEAEILESDLNPLNNVYIQAALTAGLNAVYNSQVDATLNDGVVVLNLWANNDGTGAKQDILMAVPDGGLTLAMLGAVFAGLGYYSRRRA